MSIVRCDIHDRHFDSDATVSCPQCESAADELEVARTSLAAAVAKLDRYSRLEAIVRDRSDIVDGPEGRGVANEAMSILTEWEGP